MTDILGFDMTAALQETARTDEVQEEASTPVILEEAEELEKIVTVEKFDPTACTTRIPVIQTVHDYVSINCTKEQADSLLTHRALSESDVYWPLNFQRVMSFAQNYSKPLHNFSPLKQEHISSMEEQINAHYNNGKWVLSNPLYVSPLELPSQSEPPDDEDEDSLLAIGEEFYKSACEELSSGVNPQEVDTGAGIKALFNDYRLYARGPTYASFLRRKATEATAVINRYEDLTKVAPSRWVCGHNREPMMTECKVCAVMYGRKVTT